MLATAPARVIAINARLILVSSAQRFVRDSRSVRLIFGICSRISPEDYAAIAALLRDTITADHFHSLSAPELTPMF